jgi:E3 ubiquitin-protein ligase SHPRH
LNTGLELQAIARVDRIGQHQETNVWLYLVDGTVEESIYQLSVKRRLEHIGQRLNNNNGKGKGKQLALVDDFSDTALDEANSIEMQQASLASLFAKGGGGGEIVQKKDLWECLFGGVEKKKTSHVLVDHELGQDEEVRRYLRAQAAEDRASGSGT